MNNPSTFTGDPYQSSYAYYQPYYDPSQAQNQSYYPGYDYQQHSDPYSYYSNAYHQQHQQQLPTSGQHPGTPVPPATVQTAVSEQTHLPNHQNAHYPHGIVTHHQQQSSVPGPVYGGPGAVHPPQSPYRGGSKRGGRTFRGGRGAVSARINGGWKARIAQGHGTSIRPPPCMAWCELCRVDCNTLDILEQHKSGKRHKKNMQRFEELQNLNKLITGLPHLHMPEVPQIAHTPQIPQIPQMPNMPQLHHIPHIESEAIDPSKVDDSKEEEAARHGLPSEAITNQTSQIGVDIEQQESKEKSVAEPEKETEWKVRTESSGSHQGRGFKRNMRGRRGNKRMRTNELLRPPVVPPRPKVVPLICELCNITCSSQVVFESHLTGKKHLSNLKKFQGYHARVGAAVNNFGPPNPNHPSTMFVPQISEQGLQGPPVVSIKLVPSILPNAKALAGGQASALEQAPCLENESTPNSEPACLPCMPEIGTHNAVSEEDKGHQQSLPIKSSEPPLAVSTDAVIEKGISDSEVKVNSLLQNNSAVASLEILNAGDGQVLSAKAADKAVSSAASSSKSILALDTDSELDKGVPELEKNAINPPHENSVVGLLKSSSTDAGEVISLHAII